MTIRGLDDLTIHALKEKAKKEGSSVNAALVKLIQEESTEEADAGQGIISFCWIRAGMPSNYIPWGGPGPEEAQAQRFQVALKKIGRIAAVCATR